MARTPEQVLMYHFNRRNEGNQTLTDKRKRYVCRWYIKALIKMIRYQRERQNPDGILITLPINGDWTVSF